MTQQQSNTTSDTTITDTATTRRPDGAPAWIDLSTHDIDGTRAFYSALFGWTFTDEGAEFGHYNLIYAGESLVGGLMSSVGMTCPAGGDIPTEWGVYLTVSDLAAALKATPGAGGTVVVEAMPVADRGQMAMVADAGGAIVGLWQPGSLDGMDLPTTPGTSVWFECMARDFDAAEAFYRDVFSWDVHHMEGDWKYTTHGAEADALAGLCDAKGVIAEAERPYWRVYFATADIESDLARMGHLGGTVLDGPVDSPYGRLATIRDPQGASFQLLQPPTA